MLEETMQERIDRVRANIAAAQARAGRTDEVLLMGVSKTVPAETVNEAVRLGIRCIGENRAQELEQKFGGLDEPKPDVHFIGHLQTNKVKYIIDKVSLIHSVDSVSLAAEIDRQAARVGKVQDVLVQVNIAGDAAKFGVRRDELPELLEQLSGMRNLRVTGLMTIPFKPQTAEESRMYYRQLHNLFIDIREKNHHNIIMRYLSMGMSGDYAVAVEEGANIVRVGSAIFGRRTMPNPDGTLK